MYKNVTKIFLLLMTFSLSGYAQYVSPGTWTWIGGSDTIQKRGVYRTKGTPNPISDPGGRESGATWVDTAGNFWLLGGYSYATSPYIASTVNDMWKYNPDTQEWTWVRGDTTTNSTGVYGTIKVPDPANHPGARQRYAHWTDANGDLWLFGGYGMGSSAPLGYLNDLWKYSVANDEWTYVSGLPTRNPNGVYGTKRVPSPFNMPGGREGASGWCDKQGNFWIFGGIGRHAYSAGTAVHHLNDLWKYNPVTDEWTWVAGSDSAEKYAVSVGLGVADTANTPGSRRYAASWTDSDGNFWLFGGQTANIVHKYNDLWKFDPVSEQWTWISGDTMAFHYDGTKGGQGIYGDLLVPDTTNYPGGRSGAVAFPGPDGYFWMFGGSGFGHISGKAHEYLNDLWLYNYVTNIWTWVDGDTVSADALNGHYGTIGVADPDNAPSGRYFGHGWVTANHDLWLYGGHGRGRVSNSGYLNDVWTFNTCFILGTAPGIDGEDTVCRGSEVTYSIPPIDNAEGYEWELPSGWTGSSNANSINVIVGNNGGTIRVKASNYCDTGDIASLDVFIPPHNQVFINVDTFTLWTSGGHAKYQWYFNGDLIDGATDSFYHVTENGGYKVIIEDIYGCADTSQEYMVNNVGISNMEGSKLNVLVYPNPATDQLNIRSAVPTKLIIQSLDGRTVLSSDQPRTVAIGHLQAGVYIIRLTDHNGKLIYTDKLMKITR